MNMKTLMFVEDDSILMNAYMRKFQEDPDLKLLQAWDGESAIDILGRIQPDVLVTGIHMPKKSGIGVLEFIQEKKYTFPVIVLTNQENIQFKERAMELGATEYLIKKEMSIKDLQKVLEKYLPRL